MRKKPLFESKITRLSLLPSIPLLALLLWVMIDAKISIWLIVLVGFVAGLTILYSIHRISQTLSFQFRSLNNLLNSMSQGDYSLRARSDHLGEGALSDLINSINTLSGRLSRQRQESVESQLLTRTVIEHIDVAIVALNEANEIRFVNPAARRLLPLDSPDAANRLLDRLGDVDATNKNPDQVIEISSGNRSGRFRFHVEEFREANAQHKLFFITDVQRMLRAEELKAWQSLVRVISHEINNSLSPIASISQTLGRQIEDDESMEMKNKEDVVEGLRIISARATGLREFVDRYKQLVKLPPPRKHPTMIGSVIEKTCALFDAGRITIETQNDASVEIDQVQFEQVFINLLKNALEATGQSDSPQGVVTVKWEQAGACLTIDICDEGCGITNPENLFVPFYSTKKSGSGIGLALSRQIVEAHGGRLSITNRDDARGVRARIEIPFDVGT